MKRARSLLVGEAVCITRVVAEGAMLRGAVDAIMRAPIRRRLRARRLAASRIVGTIALHPSIELRLRVLGQLSTNGKIGQDLATSGGGSRLKALACHLTPGPISRVKVIHREVSLEATCDVEQLASGLVEQIDADVDEIQIPTAFRVGTRGRPHVDVDKFTSHAIAHWVGWHIRCR